MMSEDEEEDVTKVEELFGNAGGESGVRASELAAGDQLRGGHAPPQDTAAAVQTGAHQLEEGPQRRQRLTGELVRRLVTWSVD